MGIIESESQKRYLNCLKTTKEDTAVDLESADIGDRVEETSKAPARSAAGGSQEHGTKASVRTMKVSIKTEQTIENYHDHGIRVLQYHSSSLLPSVVFLDLHRLKLNHNSQI
jgi:hypothetical protein